MGYLLSDEQATTAYRETRSRLIDLLRVTDESANGRRVPHCPAWTVGDLVAHIIGVPDDIVNGRLEGVTTDEWTQAQVARHGGRSLRELADALEAGAAGFDNVLPSMPPPVNSQVVMDTVTHEHDLRFALDQDGARDSLAVHVAVGWLLNMVDGHDPVMAASLASSGIEPWELLRSLGGRRSAAQMNAVGIDGAAVIAMLAGGPLRPPE